MGPQNMPRKPKSYPELDSLRDQMGQRPDHEIAEVAGTSTSIVGRYRRKYGIGAYEGYKFGVRESDEMTDDVGEPPTTLQDADSADSAGELDAGDADAEDSVSGDPRKRGQRGPDRSPRRSKIGPYRDQVGRVSDKDIADQAGVSREAVRMYRRRHGIRMQADGIDDETPMTSDSGAARAARRRSKLDPFSDLLGKSPDAGRARSRRFAETAWTARPDLRDEPTLGVAAWKARFG